jgi:radical SAM superfamily enzyme YgiQ (UPF0313 family)
MKVLLTTLNARYIHTSLALRYLEETIRGIPGVEVSRYEFTINTPLEDILGEIYLQKAKVAAFSCYIWNIGLTLQIAAGLKKAAPGTVVVFGGPEVSYETKKLMQEHPYIDLIVAGEGEEAFPRLLRALASFSFCSKSGQAVPSAQLFEGSEAAGKGIYWREGEKVLGTGETPPIALLESIPSPYQLDQRDLAEYQEKIAYLEASRGCPFSCSYCLSATLTGVRHFPLDRIKQELANLIAAGVKQVKFVDRTFNINQEYALELWRFILREHRRHGGIAANFHFEITADLLDQEQLSFLAQVPPGLFQFEIGVQSTNPDTLAAINRQSNLAKLLEKVRELRRANNIHLHLDLIAGLPFEDLQSFKNSFNQVIALKPHRLQLGFLKLLKGSPLREQAESFGYVTLDGAPYQVLANKFISFEELLALKEIEEVVEKVYNSRQFYYTMDYLLDFYQDKYRLFQELLAAWQEKQTKKFSQISQKEIYPWLASFIHHKLPKEKAAIVKELLKVDLLRQQRLTQLPEWADKKQISQISGKLKKLPENEKLMDKLLAGRRAESHARVIKQIQLAAISLSAAKRIMASRGRQMEAELTTDSGEVIFLFDYSLDSDPVLGGARFYPVKL